MLETGAAGRVGFRPRGQDGLPDGENGANIVWSKEPFVGREMGSSPKAVEEEEEGRVAGTWKGSLCTMRSPRPGSYGSWERSWAFALMSGALGGLWRESEGLWMVWRPWEKGGGWEGGWEEGVRGGHWEAWWASWEGQQLFRPQSRRENEVTGTEVTGEGCCDGSSCQTQPRATGPQGKCVGRRNRAGGLKLGLRR